MPENIRFISKELTDAAKTAINMEDEGYAIYVEAAKKSSNPLGKATLQAIAGKELLHKKAIEEFYAKMTGAQISPADENTTKDSEKIKTEILNDIKTSLDNKAPTENELLHAYEISMELEKKGFDFYKKVAEDTEDPAAKSLFAFLSKEENSHFDILQDTYLYLNDPAQWFHKEEKWLVEG
ncbi:MAG: ferritin family protein [Candidatus Saganbacteria bacterium]|nr:ferritin family protein [Candidatus Saganbacteria bacterium]